jgi:putative transposase
MGRNFSFAPEEFYHIYNRGTEQRNIFSSRDNYERFLSLLYVCNGTIPADLKLQGSTLYEVSKIERGEPLIDIGAYCLMPNHFHLLVRERTDNGISKFMQKLTTGYTMYFNKCNERTGSLFQGRFKAKHVKDDRYLSCLIAYIHLNPIKIIDPQWKDHGITDYRKAENFLDQYKYSSFLDYCDKNRTEKILVNKNVLPKYSETHKDFETNTKEWLQGSTL